MRVFDDLLASSEAGAGNVRAKLGGHVHEMIGDHYLDLGIALDKNGHDRAEQERTRMFQHIQTFPAHRLVPIPV